MRELTGNWMREEILEQGQLMMKVNQWSSLSILQVLLQTGNTSSARLMRNKYLDFFLYLSVFRKCWLYSAARSFQAKEKRQKVTRSCRGFQRAPAGGETVPLSKFISSINSDWRGTGVETKSNGSIIIVAIVGPARREKKLVGRELPPI